MASTNANVVKCKTQNKIQGDWTNYSLYVYV